MENIKLKTRKEELSKIYRYNGSASIMFYRPNLLIHTKRVTWLTKEICNILEKLGLKFNKNLAIELAKFHDDTEIITGDIVATKKEEWSEKEKNKYEKICRNAIDIIYKNYKHLSKIFDYKELLNLEEERNSKEFFIIKYADRLDAHLECIHEIYGGNELFIKNWYNKKFGETNFLDFTHKRMYNDLKNICKSFDINLEKLEKFNIFNLNKKIDSKIIFENYKTHNIENIQKNKAYNLYNLWINLHFKYGDKTEQEELYIKKEKQIIYMS